MTNPKNNAPWTPQVRLRVQRQGTVAIGPGKADVLQAIAHTGSLAEAGRQLGMSYQRVWSLVRTMNGFFVAPLVLTQRGGAAGGGAELTPTGQEVLRIYRAMAQAAELATSEHWPSLQHLIRPDAGAESTPD